MHIGFIFCFDVYLDVPFLPLVVFYYLRTLLQG